MTDGPAPLTLRISSINSETGQPGATINIPDLTLSDINAYVNAIYHVSRRLGKEHQ